MAFIAVPLMAKSFSVGGINVTIDLPSEYNQFFDHGQSVGFTNHNANLLIILARTSSDPLSDKYSWEKNINGVVKELFSYNGYNSLSSQYKSSETINGVEVKRFTSKMDCSTNSWLVRIAVFPVKQNTFLIAVSAVDTTNQSYYDLDKFENQGELLLYRIHLN